MATIQQLKSKLQKIDLAEIVRKSIKSTQEELVNLQQVQMLEGYKSTGERIGRYRNPQYSLYKYSRSPVAGLGNVDLYLKGNFSRGIYVRVEAGSIKFGSRDQKSFELEKKYKKSIFGLDPKNAASYSKNTLQSEIVKQIKKNVLEL